LVFQNPNALPQGFSSLKLKQNIRFNTKILCLLCAQKGLFSKFSFSKLAFVLPSSQLQ